MANLCVVVWFHISSVVSPTLHDVFERAHGTDSYTYAGTTTTTTATTNDDNDNDNDNYNNNTIEAPDQDLQGPAPPEIPAWGSPMV